MSTTSPITTSVPGVWPALYRISVDEYERMVAAGILDHQIELIQGLLVRKTGKNPPHVIAAKRLVRRLEPILPAGWHLRKEDPVRIPEFDEPEPDVAVVAGALEDYRTRHPGPSEVALLVEVAETTLDRDQGGKLSAYAAGGIVAYWIVNLVDRRIEMYTQPSPSGYQDRQDFAPGQEIPVNIAGVECGRIAASEILP